MKKVLFFLILILCGHTCFAQSMQGYVKTKGRMVNGKVVHGVGLSGVTIRIKGINVVMSGKDGKFFILLPENHTEDSIYIELISKPGYELVDRDILNRPIIYNPNTPLTIVMEEESILAEERLAIEKKLRRTLLLQLEKSEKEIQELDVNIEEKNRKFQELYNRQSSQERLIYNMVNQYGKYDYDAMSMFDLKVTECIINGELERADSLLNTKGDISERVKKTNAIKDRISQSDSILQSKETLLAIVADSLHKRGKELINEGKISEGRECTRQAMEIRKKLLGEVSEDYITSLNNYAYSFGAEKNWQKAVELQEQVMKLCGKLKTPHKNLGMYTTNMGRYYYFINDKAKAAQMWEQALPLVEKHGDIYEFLLNSLGSVYSDTRDQQGMSRIMALMEEHNQNELTKPCDEPECMLERAQYYESRGETAKAKEHFLKVVGMRMSNEIKVRVYEAYAQFLSHTKDYIAAAENQLIAAQAQHIIDGNSETHANLLYIAALYSFLGKQYQQAIDCHLTVASFYANKQTDAARRNEVKCWTRIGNAYSGLKQYDQARVYHQRVVDYYAKNAPNDNEYPKAIMRMATAEKFNKEYITSIGHHKQAMALFEEHGMASDYSDAEQSLRLCYVYADRDYSSLGTSAQRDYLLQIAEIESGNYEKTITIASRFLNELSDDDNALKFFNSALKNAVDRSGGLASPDIASIHQNIGKVYNFQGNFAKAIEEYNYALSLQRKLMRDSTRHVGQCLTLLGITYNSMKKYDMALDYYKDALNIFRNIFKENNSSEIANIYNNMGVAYENKKDKKQALLYYEMALNMRKEMYDYEHPDIAYSYSNIAGIYDHLEEFDKAIEYYKKSIDVLKKSKGSKHQDVGLMYNNIAATYYNMDEFDKSLSYFNQALEIMQIFLTEDHPNIRAIFENIVIVKKEIGLKQYDQARVYHQRVLDEIIKQEEENIELTRIYLGKLAYARSLQTLAGCYSMKNEHSKSVEYYKQYMEAIREAVRDEFRMQSETERIATWSREVSSIKQLQEQLVGLPDNNDRLKGELSAIAYDAALLSKGILLNSSIEFEKVLRAENNPELMDIYHKTKSNEEEIKRLRANATSNADLEKIVQLSQETRTLQLKLYDGCAEYADFTDYISHNWKTVQETLTSDDVAIEFTSVDPLFEGKDDYMVAIVLTKDMPHPTHVVLWNNEKLMECEDTPFHTQLQDSIMSRIINNNCDIDFIHKMQQKLEQTETNYKSELTLYLRRLETMIENDTTYRPVMANISLMQYNQLIDNNKLYDTPEVCNLIWGTLNSYISNKKRIFFSADGCFNRIGIEYLLYNDKPLSEQFEVYRLSSTKEICHKRKQEKLTKATLFGNINYNEEGYTPTISQNIKGQKRGAADDEAQFADLGNTRREVNEIYNILKGKGIDTVEPFTDTKASKTTFMSQSDTDVNILHIATHGMYDNKRKSTDAGSMKHSFLAFAGANIDDDALVTAADIATMNLRKCSLAVLSACETGLGKLGDDGVFGLQRGFKNAGVQTLLMSLKNVYDDSTADLMISFYKHLMTGATKREALVKAQKEIRSNGYNDPKHWAAFILLDGLD